VLLQDSDATLATLHTLRRFGVRIRSVTSGLATRH
jgi:hypothetical protein